VSQEAFKEEHCEDLVGILTNLIKCMIGEGDDISGWNSMIQDK